MSVARPAACPGKPSGLIHRGQYEPNHRFGPITGEQVGQASTAQVLTRSPHQNVSRLWIGSDLREGVEHEWKSRPRFAPSLVKLPRRVESMGPRSPGQKLTPAPPTVHSLAVVHRVQECHYLGCLECRGESSLTAFSQTTFVDKLRRSERSPRHVAEWVICALGVLGHKEDGFSEAGVLTRLSFEHPDGVSQCRDHG
jgi:hypothetical protein